MNVIDSGKHQITFYYGEQTLNGEPYFHTGIDLVKQTNSLDAVIAAETGKVIKVVSNVKTRDLSKGYGNYVELEHGDNTITKYCHLKHGTIKVKEGQLVSKGKELGYMGDTGYTFGAHLHFQVIINGKNVNPLPYLENKKILKPYKESSVENENYIVQADVLNVRTGPGKEYSIVKYVDLTANAKEQMKKLVNYPANGYVKGMEFTALEITKAKDESWAKTPSGWICLYNKDGVYASK